jgi:hypothetical protein
VRQKSAHIGMMRSLPTAVLKLTTKSEFVSKFKEMTNTPRRRQIVIDVLENMVPYMREPSQEYFWSYDFLATTLGFGNWRTKAYPWLKDMLLIEVRRPRFGHSVTRYAINHLSFKHLWKLTHSTEFVYGRERARQWLPIVGKFINGEEQMELDQKKPGGRLYAICQQIDRDARSWLLPGRADYDMRSAVTTLVIQTAPNSPAFFPKWSRYLSNINEYRRRLSVDYSISLKNAKKVFQLLFMQAHFNGGQGGVGAVVGSKKCKAMMKDEILTGLYEEAGRGWENLGLVDKEGSSRFDYYEQLEQQVMTEIYEVLDKNGVAFWPFHDGFTLLTEGQQLGDLQKLTDHLKAKTGYVVEFSERFLTVDQEGAV